jgi:hypothetical protein
MSSFVLEHKFTPVLWKSSLHPEFVRAQRKHITE